uniref:RNA 2-O ribose methyltransferase substrate binding domain-containing protein n=1 Tax=Oncorhynchus mykiss TaxID=8022 RepID=A0A8C7T023_ONCMY
VSAELRKLSRDDFPEDGERLVKASREGLSREEDRNYEKLFGSHRLFVKEGVASCRASVRQVCEEAHRQCVQIQGVSRRTWNKMSSGGVHQGLCLHASPLGYLPEDNTAKPPRDGSRIPLWLLLDGVQDPINILHIFLGWIDCPLTPVLSKASTGVDGGHWSLWWTFLQSALAFLLYPAQGAPV